MPTFFIKNEAGSKPYPQVKFRAGIYSIDYKQDDMLYDFSAACILSRKKLMADGKLTRSLTDGSG